MVFPVDSNVSCSFRMSLHWKEYIKGSRSIDEHKITQEFIAPFYVGLVRVSPDGVVKYLVIADIGDKD